MSHVTLAQLKAHDADGATARERFLRWMIGHNSVQTAIFEFAVDQYRAAPTAEKARTLFTLAEQGHGKTIAPLHVSPLTLADAGAWVTVHHRGDSGASPTPDNLLFDASQQDQETGLFPALLDVYDDDFDPKDPLLLSTIDKYSDDLRDLSKTLRDAGFDPAEIGFVPPYV